MVPEIVRLERAGVCGCGELVAAGERAGYTPPQERVVCLACLSNESARLAEREHADLARTASSARATSAVLPANWTADELVIAATLKALREGSSPSRRTSAPDVLHVPTEWSSTPPPQPAALALPDVTPPEQLITLPRRKPRVDPGQDADLDRPSEPIIPAAFLPSAPRARQAAPPVPPTAAPAAPPAAPPAASPAVPPTTPPAAPVAETVGETVGETVAEAVAETVAEAVAETVAETGTQTRRSRHEAAAVQDLSMPAAAPRRRAGLFSRLLTVRTFRTQQALSRGNKAHTTVRTLLEAADTKGVLSLHNRRVPGRRGPIEHIAIGATGVHVIDALHFKNASIEIRPAGDADAATDDLVVGGRVMTAAVRAVAQRVEVLRMILLSAGLDDVPVTGALCFVDGLLPLAVTDLEVGGMHVLRPSSLTALVAGPGQFDQPDRETLRQFLAERLPEGA